MKFTNLLPKILVSTAILLNLVFLFPETTAKSELNDNVFAFVLVSQMNKAWDAGHCPLSLVSCLSTLTDHWVSTFALGFPLPHYYQHLPHLAVVIFYRLLSPLTQVTLWTVFEWLKYLLLALFPLSVYYGAKKLELPPLAAGFAALLSPLVSTQYLYGTDFNAVLWRGSGMYTQLWGFVAAPLALGSLYQTIKYRKGILGSALLLALAFSGHLVFGYIVTLSTPLIVLSIFFSQRGISLEDLASFKRIKPLALSLLHFALPLLATITLTLALLSYWAVPLVLDTAWHNSHSPWDARDKFDSYGMLTVTQKLLNGDLFDANRLPVMTFFVVIGFFWCLVKFTENQKRFPPSFLLLPLMFLQWYFLYWGRATWGGLIDLLPLADGIHLHRFINGLHLSGIFLAGLGLSWLVENFPRIIRFLKLPRSINPLMVSLPLTIVLTGLLLAPVYSERLSYVKDNSNLISAHNQYFVQDYPDFLKTVDYLKSQRPGRIWVGRPGNWGNDFNVGGIHAFMQFSMADIDVSGFLPETWSPNSDVEQFFDENRLDHYQAYGLKTIVAPPDHQVPKAAKKVAQFGKFVVYDVPGVSEFEIGTVPFQIVANKKTDFSVLRLWLESTWPSFHTHPAISLTDKPLSSPAGLSVLRMDNMNNYIFQNSSPTSLFANNPFFQPPPDATPSGKILSENRGFGNYSAIIGSQNTENDYVVLKVSYNPSWRAYLDNQSVEITPVAPVFMAVKLPACATQKTPCNHTIEFRYGASPLKKILLFTSVTTLILAVTFRKRLNKLIS